MMNRRMRCIIDGSQLLYLFYLSTNNLVDADDGCLLMLLLVIDCESKWKISTGKHDSIKSHSNWLRNVEYTLRSTLNAGLLSFVDWYILFWLLIMLYFWSFITLCCLCIYITFVSKYYAQRYDMVFFNCYVIDLACICHRSGKRIMCEQILMYISSSMNGTKYKELNNIRYYLFIIIFVKIQIIENFLLKHYIT